MISCYSFKIIIIIIIIIIITASLAEGSAYLTTKYEVAGLIPGTSTILKVD